MKKFLLAVLTVIAGLIVFLFYFMQKSMEEDLAEMQPKADAMAAALEDMSGVKPIILWSKAGGKVESINASYLETSNLKVSEEDILVYMKSKVDGIFESSDVNVSVCYQEFDPPKCFYEDPK